MKYRTTFINVSYTAAQIAEILINLQHEILTNVRFHS